jgi:hypothetical protein
MEKDRQETLHKLAEEKKKKHHLSVEIDKESKRRLNLLESGVQEEHDCSVDELKGLQLSVETKRKLLGEALCDLSDADAKHSQIRKEETELLEKKSLLSEKMKDEKRKINEIGELQKKKSSELEEAKRSLSEMEDKLLLAQKKADADAREREITLNAARRKLDIARDVLRASEEETEMLEVKSHDLQKQIHHNRQKTREYGTY